MSTTPYHTKGIQALTIKDLKSITLPVAGMTCAACVSHVGNALREVTGVTSAEVNLAMEQATVEFDPERATIPELIEAVDDAGYKAGVSRVTLNIGGMTCAACVSHVGNASERWTAYSSPASTSPLSRQRSSTSPGRPPCPT